MPPLRPWSPIPIDDAGEPLGDLPAALWRLEPHPYQVLGAPYGAGASPFRLRRAVITRLETAQALLQQQQPQWRLAIFDAWRPIAVQAFMVRHAFRAACRERGLDPDAGGDAQAAVAAEVDRFWAPPSSDPATPPPHSTGAAVDLTLAEADGRPLAMGGEIDAIGMISHPDHYAAASPGSEAADWHARRRLLAAVMGAAGFAQHPNEWWHFSHGDQLWAWRSQEPLALYGAVAGEG
ncbi:MULTISPECIES: M15 family metallopeptidase [unclassified Cyanobium]|uniref:M15 family metallopeptidase n=1 Tax=unclassified Cyanobium TaxID=2627006 RepID=UPI0020CCF7E9|nr:MULTISPECIES: M15 family metallopeptidase [unclassified Cyanobium]MCP9858296.1 D-alanyl-D-alanine dipeptidase [Cyanobium sp. Cruz-8H5]MCP9865677.1 D-alanyl-D-alanine dipeptidase [Cyanobium sp. Cruz-8D1]